MAYITQEKKKEIAGNLKSIVPAGWKYSLAVRDHRTLVMTIKSAPVDIIRAMKATEYFDPESATTLDLYGCCTDGFKDSAVAGVFDKIRAVMNAGNHDNSDMISDYHDVWWYVKVHIGSWDKPFLVC